MSIPAPSWNGMIDRLGRNRILGVTLLNGGTWRHPWNVSAAWNDGRQAWQAQIEPGFVNGQDAAVEVPVELASRDTLDRLKSAGEKPVKNVEAWLTEFPAIPLTIWRSLGPDAEPSVATVTPEGGISLSFEPVPEFFASRGVATPQAITLDEGTSATAQVAGGDERLLRAMDIILVKDRIGTSTSWSEGSGIDGTFAQFTTVVTKAPSHRERAVIQTRQQWTAPQEAAPETMLSGGWEDRTFDEYLLATVYLLSPPKTPRNSIPDGAWTPFVAHRLFWNLNHDTNHPLPPLATQNLTLFTGLAGGLADPLINIILAQVNDAASAAAQFLRLQKIEARIWSV